MPGLCKWAAIALDCNFSHVPSLNFLVQQVHTTCQNKESVATLLLLDMSKAFDRVIPARLLHNIRESKVHERMVKWVGSFISNRTTTLCSLGYNTDAFPRHTGITQGSPPLPLLFLFYNANLIEPCNPPTLLASRTSFVDDVNALAFNKSTEENSRML